MTDQATFNALVLDEDGGKVAASIKQLNEAALPEGDVTVDIAFSPLNPPQRAKSYFKPILSRPPYIGGPIIQR